MTKQQEIFIDVSKLTLETIVKNGAGNSKGNEDMQDIKALQTELDKLHTDLKSNLNMIKASKEVLLHLEQEINTRTTNKNEIFRRLLEIKGDIEDEQNHVNVLKSQISDTNNKIKEEKKHLDLINKDDYKYTEIIYKPEHKVIFRYSGHYTDWVNTERGWSFVTEAKTTHIPFATFTYHETLYSLLHPEFCEFRTQSRYNFKASGAYNEEEIDHRYIEDIEGFEKDIADMKSKLEGTEQYQNEQTANLIEVEKVLQVQMSQKLQIEESLQKIENMLKVAEMEKEKTEVKLQKLLQEQESLEIKSAELQELINKEEVKIAEEVQKSKETAEVKYIKLLRIMELIENGNITEENRQLLVEALQDLKDIDQEGEFNRYLENGGRVLDTYFPDLDKTTKIGFQEHKTEDSYVYLTGNSQAHL